MAKIIAFSGGCYSGKTTALQALAKELEARGVKVAIIEENIRKELDKLNLSIDEARNNPNLYFSIQCKIINEKITRELIALKDTSETVYLEDRAITDSIYYFLKYVKYNNLNDFNKNRYRRLHKLLISHAKENLEKYYLVLYFYKLHDVDYDTLRTKYRPEVNDTDEEHSILMLNKLFFYSGNVASCDLNICESNDIIEDLFLSYGLNTIND